MFFLKMNKDNKRKRAIMKWVKGVMQAIFNIVTFGTQRLMQFRRSFLAMSPGSTERLPIYRPMPCFQVAVYMKYKNANQRQQAQVSISAFH
jgi:hypothetical protein